MMQTEVETPAISTRSATYNVHIKQQAADDRPAKLQSTLLVWLTAVHHTTHVEFSQLSAVTNDVHQSAAV